MTKSNVVEEFSKEKYENQNPIAKLLVNGFFSSLEKLYLQIDPSDRNIILEAACGPGFSTEKIYNFAPTKEFVASDIEPELVAETAKKLPQLTTQVGSIYDIEYSDGYFDVVFALEVLEHLEEPEKAIAQISRVSNKYAIISCPNEPIWRLMNMARGKFWANLGNTPGHINHWGLFGLKKLINKEFEIVAASYTLPWQMYLCIKK
jgi:ubiquinone/menaquinone biosynthesis C-methylase UbiE